jgi:hypothetical protein
MPELGERAVVLGASMGGLDAARVLADFFRTVTAIERDLLPPMTPLSDEGYRRVGIYMFCCRAARRSWMSSSPGFSMSWYTTVLPFGRTGRCPSSTLGGDQLSRRIWLVLDGSTAFHSQIHSQSRCRLRPDDDRRCHGRSGR